MQNSKPIAWVDFSSRCVYAPGDGPLTQEMVDSIWACLPATGTAYVAKDYLYVEPSDGERLNCGRVADGVTDVSASIVQAVRAADVEFCRQRARNGDKIMDRA
jgi:hypothetical protein